MREIKKIMKIGNKKIKMRYYVAAVYAFPWQTISTNIPFSKQHILNI